MIATDHNGNPVHIHVSTEDGAYTIVRSLDDGSSSSETVHGPDSSGYTTQTADDLRFLHDLYVTYQDPNGLREVIRVIEARLALEGT